MEVCEFLSTLYICSILNTPQVSMLVDMSISLFERCIVPLKLFPKHTSHVTTEVGIYSQLPLCHAANDAK